jgi:hypothetical protein
MSNFQSHISKGETCSSGTKYAKKKKEKKKKKKKKKKKT